MGDGHPPNAEKEPRTLEDEEFDRWFDDPELWEGDLAQLDLDRGAPWWARVLAVIAALAMLAGTITILVDEISDFSSLNDAGEIREAALERVAESEWGWLVSDVRIVPIPEPRIGGRVTNNPPDGIITVDLRPWSPDRLDELIDHEIGHLVDFAVWGAQPPEDRRGGLASEPWAECAAVGAGTRELDRAIIDDRYHCRAEEYVVWQSEMAALDEVCRRWDERECRPAPAR